MVGDCLLSHCNDMISWVGDFYGSVQHDPFLPQNLSLEPEWQLFQEIGLKAKAHNGRVQKETAEIKTLWDPVFADLLIRHENFHNNTTEILKLANVLGP